MNRLVRQWAMSTVSICAIQIANAQVDILNIVPVQTPEQGTEIRVTFNRLPPEPQAYQLEKPSRLILDFEQVKPNLTQNSVAVLSSEVNSVDVAADDLRSRLTVNLAQAGQFTTRVEGNTFILKVNNTKNDTLPTQQKTIVNAHKGISNIDFQRGINGEGQVLIQLFDAHTPVDVQQQGTKVIVRFLGNKIPKNLAQRLNVNDFATPVTAVDAYNEGANGVIAIQTTGAYEYMAYQAEKQLTISLKNFSTQKAASLAVPQPKYSGQKVSLDFQDIEVRRVLQLLADFANTNLVAADSVTGNISLRMKDVPWDQALDIILKAKNLDKRQNGNVVWIAPVIELAKADEDQAKMLEQQIKIAPIQTEYIQLSYAKVEDIEKLITSNKTASNNNLSSSSDNKNNESLLSGRGSVSIDKRTNTLIVNDTEPFIVKIRRMVDLLDVPVKQVMVEARVVTADTNFTRELGVKWGLQRNNPSFPNTPGSNVWGGNLSPSFDLGVNLAAENAAGTFSFGLLKISDYMLNLQLSAMQADGYGEVLSAPKVLTGDKQRAYILRGDQIPYRTWSAETGVKTEFMDANLKLEVTPSITPDGKVQMSLKIEKDTVGQLTDAGYVLKTNELETNVLVDDGQTVVLGGIFDEAKTNDYEKVPFFGDLPVIGHLFKNSVKTNQQSELLIFITPRIVNDTLSRNH
ncbi:type IV pilus secretin PilQ [Acinetobacter equi]|uniref:Secretin/TonB short N-terminal domain-containing protein n=1 Tax=Acinetobacter equi TaxID=1324350 RepID=A0A0N9VCL5_9GAMM|nr:type IV pilus secretin PilQ [Acinetobacter equi]ALH94992.1 hypothetical protein AOY20_05260 [Acinetobacter equi]